MASGTINNNAPVYFGLTSNSNLSTSGGTGLFFPESNTVVVFGEASSGSNITTSTVLATIPTGYRPSASRSIAGRYTTDANANSATMSVNINTDGTIKQSSSNALRSISFFGAYQL